jgi:hypothetical protein
VSQRLVTSSLLYAVPWKGLKKVQTSTGPLVRHSRVIEKILFLSLSPSKVWFSSVDTVYEGRKRGAESWLLSACGSACVTTLVPHCHAYC